MRLEQESLIDKHVGERIKLIRKVSGLSQSKLGKKLDVTFQQVQKMEKGANRVGAGRLLIIANFFDVNIDYFYEGLEKPNRLTSSLSLLNGLSKLTRTQLTIVKSIVSEMSDRKVRQDTD